MKKILTNPVIVSISICLGLYLCLVSLSIFWQRRIMDFVQPLHDTQYSINQESPLQAHVSPHHSGANVINIFLKNVALRNTDPLVFTLSRDSQILREIHFSGSNVGDGTNVRFQFLPLPDDLPFDMTISAPQTSYTNSIYAQYSSSQKQPTYELYYSPQSKFQQLQSLHRHIISTFSLKLILTWLVTGLLLAYSIRRLRL